MSTWQERMRKEQEKREEEKANKKSGNFEKRDIWFKWTKKEHTIRLVGDCIVAHKHWIGPSDFNDVDIYDESNFAKGDNRLPYQINCGNWDIEKEMEDNGKCVICQLREIASEVLYSEEGKKLDEKNKKFFKDLRYKCDVKTRYYFNCIDRDNPYVTEDKKFGYKIIEMPYELMDGLLALSTSLTDVDLSSVTDGIDLKITKSGGGSEGKVKYGVLPIMKGLSIKATPLTEQEKETELNDLALICGKMQDQEELTERLKGEIRGLLTCTSSSGDSPF